MNVKILTGLALLLAARASLAIDTPPTPEQVRQEHQQSETWLQYQASGQGASPTPQTAAPTEQEMSVRRWLDTYKHPIPEFFDQDKGGKTRGNAN